VNDYREKVAIDKSRANKEAIGAINADQDLPILVRQVKDLNNIVEQDHCLIKRVTKPMLNFKSFHCAGSVIAGFKSRIDPERLILDQWHRWNVTY
jgi:transposase-like protein